MTLGGAVLFPGTRMPLYIFEPRYRAMLRDVLAGHRMFAIAMRDDEAADADPESEPLHRIACVGRVNAWHENPDGTTHLLLEGVSRVQVDDILVEKPYRRIAVTPLPSTLCTNSADQCQAEAEQLLGLLDSFSSLREEKPEQFLRNLESLSDPALLTDMVASTFVEAPVLKQKLLAELDPCKRLRALRRYFRARVDELDLLTKLRGGLSDEEIERN